MTDLINQAGAILEKSAELVQIPAVSGAIDSFFNWLSGVFSNKKKSLEQIELIKQNNHNKETITGLMTNLDFVIDDNEDLRKQLEIKVKELDELAKKAGVKNITKTNTMTITGNGNIGLQDINGGNININK
jgi:hypothetical protein